MAVGPDPSMQSVTSRNWMLYLIHIQPAVSTSSPPLYIEIRHLLCTAGHWLCLVSGGWMIPDIHLGTQGVSESRVQPNKSGPLYPQRMG